MTDAPAPPDLAHEPPPPSSMVRAIVVLTTAVVLAMVVLIYMQWLAHSEPSSMVIVEADASAAGVVVDIARVRPNGKTLPPVQIELSERNAYTAHYFLEAGSYEVKASRDDQVFFQFHVRLPEYRAYKTSLVGRVPTTAPASPGLQGRAGERSR